MRHGRVYNPANILYGRLPRFGLSAEGLREAQWAARALSGAPLAAVFSSPLLRARQTAKQILLHHRHLKLKVSELLNEVHSPFEGHDAKLVDERKGDVYSGAAPEFEQPQDVVTRLQKFIDRVRRRYEGRHVVAVTHGDNITFTLLWARNMPPNPRFKRHLKAAGFSHGYPATASLTTLTFHSPSNAERPQVTYDHPAGRS